VRQPVALAALLLWPGLTLLLAEVRRIQRPTLAQRLQPYGRGAALAQRPALDFESWREVIGPLCRSIGEGLARLLGVTEEAGARLERLHRPIDATGFRVRQIGWATLALGGGVVVAAATRPSPLVALLFVFGAPVLA
jgi:hypothetical protein